LKEKSGDWKTANALPIKSGKAIELAIPGQLVWPGNSTAPEPLQVRFKTISRRPIVYLTENRPSDQRNMPLMKGF